MEQNGTLEKSETIKEVGKFGSVGILNTVIDLGLFNILVFSLNMAPVSANVIAVGAAIINSYVWNKLWTFNDKNTKNVTSQAALFISLSLIGLVLNTSVLKLLTDIWIVPGNFALSIIRFINLDSVFSDQFVTVNFAKAWGLAVSMIWNFLTYKKFVFKK